MFGNMAAPIINNPNIAGVLCIHSSNNERVPIVITWQMAPKPNRISPLQL